MRNIFLFSSILYLWSDLRTKSKLSIYSSRGLGVTETHFQSTRAYSFPCKPRARLCREMSLCCSADSLQSAVFEGKNMWSCFRSRLSLCCASFMSSISLLLASWDSKTRVQSSSISWNLASSQSLLVAKRPPDEHPTWYACPRNISLTPFGQAPQGST